MVDGQSTAAAVHVLHLYLIQRLIRLAPLSSYSCWGSVVVGSGCVGGAGDCDDVGAVSSGNLFKYDSSVTNMAVTCRPPNQRRFSVC